VIARVRLKRAGRGRIRPVKVGLVLARGAKPKGGIALAGKPAVAALGPRGAALIVTGKVPAKAKTGRALRVLACIGATRAVARGTARGGCAASRGKLRIAAPGSVDSIDAAVAAGKLDHATAVLYHLYALAGDPRLPAKYASSLGDADGHAAITDAAASFSSLPPAIQRKVFPFFIPPAARNSALGGKSRGRAIAAGAPQGPVNCQGFDRLSAPVDQDGQFAGTWRTVASADGHALVHYITWAPVVPNPFGSPSAQLTHTADEMSQQSRSAAARYALAMPRIWAKLTAEFGAPQSDANEPCYNGGDGRLDVYVDATDILRTNKPGATALTLPYPQVGAFCTDRPAFIVMNRDEEPWTLAHEFMHALQFAHHYKSCGEPIGFWDEGGADWAADFVYPDVQREQTRAPHNSMLRSPYSWSPTFADYEFWPFWMMLQRTYGTDVLRSVFNAMTSAQAIDAVNQAIPGGWKEQLPKLLIHLWNQGPIGEPGFPVSTSYKDWDHYGGTPSVPPEMELNLGGKPVDTIKFTGIGDNPSPLELGTIQRVSIPDAKVRELSFINGGFGHGVHVDAALHLADGSWKLQDWSGQNTTLCRDKPEEDVRDLIVFTTGVSTTQGSSATHQIQGRNTCPPPKYVAQITNGMETTDAVDGCHEHWQISYSASLSDSYSTTPGEGFYLPHPEGGPPQSTANAYQEDGTGSYTLPPCDPDPGCSTSLQKYQKSGPGEVTFDLKGPDIKVSARSFTWENSGANPDCSGDPPVGVGRLGEGTFPRSMVGAQTITVQISYDETFSGRHGVGSATVTLHRVS
jgi:hypothetical protein